MFTSKANVEDFIWAIRQRHQNIKDEELKARGTIFQDRKKSLDVSGYWEKKTKILASLVPDEVIQNVNDYSHKRYNACLLFGDVSGFTELTEKYNEKGKGGPSRLTLVLNGYIGALIQEIMSFGGDIFKFSGDAFLSVWKCRDEQQIMRDYVHQALDCALVIQKNYGTFETDVGTYLRVKLAIAAGPVIFTLIGNEKYSHYIIIGKPIFDVKDAEHRSKAGEIVVAPSAWYHVNATDYISTEVDESFRKVVGIGPSWRHLKGENKYSLASQQIDDGMSEDVESQRLNSDQDEVFTQMKNMEFALRPIMHQAGQIKANLRKFILPPVMSCVEHDEPIEYLTEMRRAVIMFINLTTKRCTYDGMATLINEWYIAICQSAEKYKGCVNKVSMFDKDIMFVVIFGLRGFKHDLECQFALKCASNVFDLLNNHKSVKTVSIACTTGKTYCGIVGHTLRREYTVMSLIVNKAARIMMNYPDRVACDSSTFQHSKLAANYFILQVYKPLKGISNPGPVYEFQEGDNKTAEQASVSVNYYPILGRDKEVQMYLEMLKVFLENADKYTDKLPFYTRMIIVKGLPRQGKTRLMEEFVIRTDPGIPVTKLLLNANYLATEYLTARTILYKILNVVPETPVKDKMELITNHIGTSYRQYLSCLNGLLQVHFESSEEYEEMSDREKMFIAGKIVKNLSYACLQSVWIFTIDKGKFIDESSWRILHALLACRCLFFVLALDGYAVIPQVAEKIMKHRNVIIMHLANIPRIYHAGLACQILNVFAISADLENLLHTKSNGNPGWIEALLISLKQAHQVFIRNADYRAIYQFGLVAPPLYMMKRMSPENVWKWKQILEEKKSNTRSDNWGTYIDTCRDEIVDIMLREKIHKTCSKDKYLPVCFLNPKFDLTDIDSELSKEGRLIMTFDSLNYQEQLLLKCSSVLGDSFPRSMLVYVMQRGDASRETAEVVMSLFEKRVLCCAKGDFSEGGNYLLIREKMVDPSKDYSIKCSCLGIYVCDDVKDLPKYASCGYLRFISSIFRQTTYNLLTDSQKKMFHARTAKYLVKETRKCSSCGGAFFDLTGYCKLESKHKHPARKSLASIEPSDNSLTIYGSLYSGPAETRSEYTTMTTISPRSHSFSKRSAAGYSRYSAPSIGTSLGHALAPTLEENDEDSFYARNFGVLNPLKVLKYKDNYSLTKAFTRADFQTCHCHLILSYLFNQLIFHYRGSGQWLEMINSMTEYAKVCMGEKNFAGSLIYVKEALNYLSTSGNTLGVPKWRVPVLEAKLYTWYGTILKTQQQKDEALKMLLLAMTKFGYPFPKTRLRLHLTLSTKRLRQRLGMYLFPDRFLDKNLSEEDTDVVDNISCCLNKLFSIFITNKKYKQAELAAVWSLTKALEAGTNLFQVCFAFANMILIANYQLNRFLSLVLEVHSLRFCHKKRYGIDPPELKAVIELYYVIFETRLARAEYDDSLHMGYILSRLTVAANDYGTTVKTFGKIILMLMVKMFLAECITILQELSYHISEYDSPEGKAEFYASALLFQIETGYNFIPFRDIEKYYKAECLLSPCAQQRKFLTLLRAWYCRTNHWEAASIVNAQIKTVPQRSDPTEILLHMAFCLQGLYEVEYQLMLFVFKINRRNIYGRPDILTRIQVIWKKLSSRIAFIQIAKPRYYILKAYEAMIWNKENKMLKFVKLARKYAVKQGNILQLKLVDFLERFWTDKLTDEEAQEWMKHTEPDNYLEYNQLNNADAIMCYPFCPPLYY